LLYWLFENHNKILQRGRRKNVRKLQLLFDTEYCIHLIGGQTIQSPSGESNKTINESNCTTPTSRLPVDDSVNPNCLTQDRTLSNIEEANPQEVVNDDYDDDDEASLANHSGEWGYSPAIICDNYELCMTLNKDICESESILNSQSAHVIDPDKLEFLTNEHVAIADYANNANKYVDNSPAILKSLAVVTSSATDASSLQTNILSSVYNSLAKVKFKTFPVCSVDQHTHFGKFYSSLKLLKSGVLTFNLVVPVMPDVSDPTEASLSSAVHIFPNVASVLQLSSISPTNILLIERENIAIEKCKPSEVVVSKVISQSSEPQHKICAISKITRQSVQSTPSNKDCVNLTRHACGNERNEFDDPYVSAKIVPISGDV